MNTLKEAVNYILSNEYLDYVISTGKWCDHGSQIFNYFDCEDLIFEYSDSRLRRKLIKDYIFDKVDDILDDLNAENPDLLYRAIYLDKKPCLKGFFGHYWSSRKDTNICVELNSSKKEFLLCLDFNKANVNWVETLKSRLDYAYGDREKEYYLNSDVVNLDEIFEI